MLKMFMSLLIILISINMFFMNNPLSMGMLILMQTILTSMLSGMLIKTYWFSYILFLTFLGGLLVMFIYVSSITSNELFNMKFNSKMMMIFFLIIIMITTIMLNNNMNWLNFNNNSDMINFMNNFFMNNLENKINLNKLYNNQTFLMMMMMIIYLFITLIAVVKITNIFYGPLRSNLNK